MPSDPRSPEMAQYTFRNEIALTLSGIEAMIDQIEHLTLVTASEAGCEPEDLPPETLEEAIDEMSRIRLAAACLRGRTKSEMGYR